MISTTERNRRFTALRAMMHEKGYAVLVVAGNAEATQRGYVRYLSNWRLWGGKGFVLLPVDTKPVLVLGAGSQSHWAPRIGWITDVRPAGNMLAELIATLQQLGVDKQLIGVVGLTEVMVHGDVVTLQQGLPAAKIVDATEAVDALMAIKSDEEIAHAAQTYGIIADALDTFKAQLAPGKSERAVMAEALRFLAEHGCHDGIAHLTSGVQPFFRPPTDRIITAEDILKVSLEFAGPEGYWIELSGVYSFRKPSQRLRRHYETTRAALANAATVLRPGATGRELTQAIEDTFKAAGWKVTGRGIWDGHAIGLVVIRPPYGVLDSNDEFHENMIINVHPGLLVDEDRLGLFMQDNFVVTANGGRTLGNYQHEWHILGG